MSKTGFTTERAQLYRESINEYAEARAMDIALMEKYLAPKEGEHILEVGAGTGFFSGLIADAIGREGLLIVSDPSKDQLIPVAALNHPNITIKEKGAEALDDLEKNALDAIWSFGAIHHAFEKMRAFEHFAAALKEGGRLVIVDVLSGTSLAKHFDSQVARYSNMGHEVAFLTHEYFDSLCALTGLRDVEMIDIPVEWKFSSEEEIGDFLYKLHAMTKTTREECLRGAKEMLGIEYRDGMYYLSWPLTVFLAKK